MAEPPYGHESSAIAVARLVRSGAVLALGVILTVALVGLALRERQAPAEAQVAAQRGTIPPPPRLQAHPVADLATLRREKEAQLEGWGWDAPERRFAHIPIERAMAIYLRDEGSRQ